MVRSPKRKENCSMPLFVASIIDYFRNDTKKKPNMQIPIAVNYS